MEVAHVTGGCLLTDGNIGLDGLVLLTAEPYQCELQQYIHYCVQHPESLVAFPEIAKDVQMCGPILGLIR